MHPDGQVSKTMTLHTLKRKNLTTDNKLACDINSNVTYYMEIGTLSQG